MVEMCMSQTLAKGLLCYAAITCHIYVHTHSGESSNITVNNSTNISCAEGFFVSGSACIPSCAEWSLYSDASTFWQNVVLGVAATFGLISGILVVIGSCIRRSVM